MGRRLVLAVLLAAFVTYDVMTVAHQFGSPHAGHVDFGVYYRAAQALSHGDVLYSRPPPCCFNAGAMNGYTYPPLFAALLAPLSALSVDEAGGIWLAVMLVSLAAIMVIGVRAAPGRIGPEAVGWLVLLLVSSGSVLGSLYELQATPLVVALQAVFAWSVVQDRHVAGGGFALALAAGIKVSPLLAAPAALLVPGRGALRALAALSVGLGVATVVMLIVSKQVFFYVTQVLPSFSSGVVSTSNHSMPGVVLLALHNGGIRPGGQLASMFFALEVVALALTWMLCRGVPGKAGRAIMIAALLGVVPIVQGVTWDHHLIVEILVLILVLPLLRKGSLAWVLGVCGTALAMVEQSQIYPWLAARGWNPPHGAIQFAVLTLASALDLLGMCALWLAIVLTARSLRRVAQLEGTVVARAVREPTAALVT